MSPRPAFAPTGGHDLPRRRKDEEADPDLLYAGQWRDAESGLCYNRFRYYKSESGMYLVSDPLGLMGGEQTYRYVSNPCGWVDPFGLAACPKKIKALLEGKHGDVVYVRSKKEADELLKAAFSDFQKVKGIGHQKITGGNVKARIQNKIERFEERGRAYHKDYAVGKDGRPISHKPGKEWHEYPHIDINRGSDGVMDVVHIAIRV